MSKTVPSYASVLALHQLEADIYLGVGEKERSALQRVIIDVRLYLPELPAAWDNDDAEYLCYHSLSEKIQALCTQRPYKLIEYLVHATHRLVRASVPPETGVWVRLRKPQILLPYVRGGSSYTYSDLPPSAYYPPE